MGARDRGSMVVLVVFVGLGITTGVTLGLSPVLVDLIDRQRAQSAADAAALAGVSGGRAASWSIAAANDAMLVEWSRDGQQVSVRVEVGDQRASARATDEP